MPKLGKLYILHIEIPDWYYQDILEQKVGGVFCNDLEA